MKILYFYPENPLLKVQGNNARANKLLDYFKSRKIQVDFVGEKSVFFTEKDAEELKIEKGINKVFLLNGLNRKKNKIKYLFLFSIPNKLKKGVKLYNRLRYGHKNEFQDILKNNDYDIVLISYVYWAQLLGKKKYLKEAKTFIDTHDFLTSQFQNKKNFNLGNYFENEITILNEFDKILVISIEEKYLFSQFINKKVELVSHILPFNDSEDTTKEFDIIYVASDNEHNIKAAEWFFTKVYPNLIDTIKIVVIGKITKYVPEFKNIKKISFVEDLDLFYKKSRISICPMLSGTGVKIKVVEALSFGLPVVCNERGVDGLLNKRNNGCLVTDNENVFAENIIQLLTDNHFYEKVSHEATLFFNENHSMKSNYTILDNIFKL